MKPDESQNRIARQLEKAKDVADVYTNKSQGRTLHDDLLTLARTDLYAALRLWEQYASQELKAQPGAMPTIIHVGKLTERHFEGRSQQERSDVIVPNERDVIVGRPTDKETYEGLIVGTTPDYVVQRLDRGDFILHRKASLTGFQPTNRSNVSIHYPFNAINGIGIVRETMQFQTRNSMAHETAKAVERTSHEREFG